MKDLLNSLRGGDNDKEKLYKKLKKQVSELPEKAETKYQSLDFLAPMLLLYSLKLSGNDCAFIQYYKYGFDDEKPLVISPYLQLLVKGGQKVVEAKDLSKKVSDTQLKLIDEGITRCKKHNKIPVLFIHIQIRQNKKVSSVGHANMLIFNWKRNEIERFEPQSYKTTGVMGLMHKEIDNYIIRNYVEPLKNKKYGGHNFKYVDSSDIECPIGLQDAEESIKYNKSLITGKNSGYCMVWSSFYTTLRLEYPLLSYNDIINTIYDVVSNDPNILMRYIVNYSTFIEKLFKEWGIADKDYDFVIKMSVGKRKVSETDYRRYNIIHNKMKRLVEKNTEILYKKYTSDKPVKREEKQTISSKVKIDPKIEERKKAEERKKELENYKDQFTHTMYDNERDVKRGKQLIKDTDTLIKTQKERTKKERINTDRKKELEEFKKKLADSTYENERDEKRGKQLIKDTDTLIKPKKERKKREKKERKTREKKVRKTREKKERKKREKKVIERKKMDIDHNSIFSKYTVPMLNDMIKDFIGITKGLSYMNKGYKIYLLKSANIDVSLLPDIPVKGSKRYGVSRGLVKPYNEAEQSKFLVSNYSELHPLMAKKLDPVKHKRQYEMNIKIELNAHQKNFIVNFINSYFRGGLMFHSVGAGKTLTAVAFSHYYLSLYPNRNVCIISPPTLLFNFVEAMNEYGLDIRDNRFQFHTYIKFSKNYDSYINDDTLLIIDEIHNFRTFIQYGVKEIDGADVSVPIKGMLNEKIIKACQRCRKILGLTGTPFVNKLYDIENQLAMINRRAPTQPDQFDTIIKDDSMTYDYFKYRISHFDIFKTDHARFFPEKREEYVKIILPNKPPFRRIYELATRGNNPYEDNANEAIYHEKYLTSLDYYTPDGKLWTKGSKKKGLLKHIYEKAPEMDYYGRVGHTLLQTIQKEDDDGNKLSAKQLKDAPRIMAKREQLTSFYNAGRQFGNIVDGLKIKFIIKKLEENPTYKSIVFSSFIQSSLVPLRKILTEKKIKFTLITGSESPITRQQNKEKFNDINSDINVLLISSAGTEGVSTKNVRQLFVFESQWNEALTEQAIARAIRFKSHNGLPEDQNFCNIYRLQLVASKSDNEAVDKFNSGVFKNVAVEFIKMGQERDRLEQTILKEIKETQPALYSMYRRENEMEQIQIHRQSRPGIGQKKQPYEFSQERFKSYALSQYIKRSEVIEKADRTGTRSIIYKYMEILKKLENSDKKHDIVKLSTLSSDIALTKISIIKDVIITNFIKDLDNKVPQIESFKEPLHEALIKAVDEEKDVSKLLQQQRKILDEIGETILEETADIQTLLLQSEYEKNKKLNDTKTKMNSVDKYNEFFTPPEIVAEALSYSDKLKSKEYIKVLEPTAGFGSFVRGVIEARTEINDKGTHIDMVEINDKNREVLQTLYVDTDPFQFNLMETKNFLQFTPQENYDLIVMNPPFHLKHSLNRATIDRDMYDIDFVKRAYGMLIPGGELIGIVSSYLSHGKIGNKRWIENTGVKVLKEYRGYKWSPTKEKEEKGKKSTKLTLNFDIIRIVKPENAVLEPPEEVIIEPEPEPEPEQKRKSITTKRDNDLFAERERTLFNKRERYIF